MIIADALTSKYWHWNGWFVVVVANVVYVAAAIDVVVIAVVVVNASRVRVRESERLCLVYVAAAVAVAAAAASVGHVLVTLLMSWYSVAAAWCERVDNHF